ncbi:hypothetical protein [Demequina pelophila]|uniref:hypothetical protein n=1 Tax=Demequina pelophila TaxID=1638984 RepID=UPI0007809C88|nr:hypothetical protein [Demequina pelophila]
MTRARRDRPDVSALLGLGSPGAAAVLGVFVATNVAFTLTTLDTVAPDWPPLVACALVSAAGALLWRRHPDPFPLRDTALVVATMLASTLLVSWCLPAEGAPGRASWHLGSNTWLAWFLILRGRAGWAWMGAAGMSAITVAWAVTTGRPPMTAFTLLDTQIALLGVAALFVASLRRAATAIAELRERSVRATASAASAEARRDVRLHRSGEVAALAGPVLARIATGTPLTAAERDRARAIEARLRDGVRGSSLATPAVLDAAAEARARGVDVNLLDDRGAALDEAAMRRVEAAVIAALDGARDGSVTVRLLPAGRAEALTVVALGSPGLTRIVLDDDGRDLPAPAGAPAV